MARFIRELLFGGAGAATPFGNLGLFVVRVGVGGLLAVGHGYGKMFGGGFGPGEALVGGLEQLGVPAPLLSAWLTTIAEFVGASLLALGLFTRPAALMVAINMAVAAFVGHQHDPVFGAPPSKELALLYLLPSVMLLFTGAGRISIDALLRDKRAA